MAKLELPPRAETPPNGRHDEPPPAPRWAGDDAVPRGLAVTSAVTLRVIIVVGGVVLLGLFAKLMMVVVVPVVIAMLLATLLAPVRKALRRRRLGAGLASFLSVLLGRDGICCRSQQTNYSRHPGHDHLPTFMLAQ